MARSLQGVIGAALLSGAALVAQSQQPAAPPPAPAAAPAASATTTQPVSKSLGLIVYPAQKQSASQQSVDEQECYNWAKAQTGIDPQAPPPAATVAEAPKQGGQRLKGAAKGAAAGAVIGEVADNDVGLVRRVLSDESIDADRAVHTDRSHLLRQRRRRAAQPERQARHQRSVRQRKPRTRAIC